MKNSLSSLSLRRIEIVAKIKTNGNYISLFKKSNKFILKTIIKIYYRYMFQSTR